MGAGKWIGGALVCAGAVLAVPYGIGWYMKTHWQEFLQPLEDTSSCTMRLASFTSGWLASHAETVITVHNTRWIQVLRENGVVPAEPGSSDLPVEIRLQHTVKQGPLIWHAGKFQLALAQIQTSWKVPERWRTFAVGLPEAMTLTQWAYWDQSHTVEAQGLLDVTIDGSNHMRVPGIQIRGMVDPRNKTQNIAVDLSQMVWNAGAAPVLSVNKIHWDQRWSQQERGGPWALAAQHAAVEGVNSAMLQPGRADMPPTWEGLRIQNQLTHDAGQWLLKVDATLDHLRPDGRDFGPIHVALDYIWKEAARGLFTEFVKSSMDLATIALQLKPLKDLLEKAHIEIQVGNATVGTLQCTGTQPAAEGLGADSGSGVLTITEPLLLELLDIDQRGLNLEQKRAILALLVRDQWLLAVPEGYRVALSYNSAADSDFTLNGRLRKEQDLQNLQRAIEAIQAVGAPLRP